MNTGVPPDALAGLGAGFADTVHGSQQTFRALLTAHSHPGRIGLLPASAMAGLQPPAALDGTPLAPATAASLLTLLDADSPAHLAGQLDSPAVRAWLRFHAGARLAPAAEAAFGVVRAAELDPTLWQSWCTGSDEAPQEGATVVVEVAEVAERVDCGPDSPRSSPLPAGAVSLGLTGPGIAGRTRLAVWGLSPGLWRARQAQQALAPRGVDLLLCCGARLVAIPRSTQLVLED